MNYYLPDPELTAPHVSCRMLTGFLEYFEELEGAEFVSAVVTSAGLPMGYVRTPERWVSREYVDRFVAEVCRRLGVMEAEPDHFHPVRQAPGGIQVVQGRNQLDARQVAVAHLHAPATQILA